MKILLAVNVRWWNAEAGYAWEKGVGLRMAGHDVSFFGLPGSPALVKAASEGFPVFAEKGLNARNPLDITPMAKEEVYEGAVRVMLESDDVDAVVVGVVPLTLALETTAEGIGKPGSLADRLPRLFKEAKKPMIVVVDAGPRYQPLVDALREGGVPVFPSADQAIRSLGRYLCHRAE